MIDFPFKFSNRNENRAWSNGCLWLSLDRFERFWPDVGLTFSNGAAVKTAVRGALRVEYAVMAEFRARFSADPDCEDDLYHTDRFEALARVCFRSIIETAGAHDADCIARWLVGPVYRVVSEYAVDQHPWYRTWCNLLYGLRTEDPDLLASSYGIDSHTAQRIVAIAAHFESEDAANRARVEEADQEPLQGWDAIAYADYRWESPEPSPLDGLGRHLRYVSFDRAWAEILSCTHPTDIDALVNWGRGCVATRMSGVEEQDAIIPDDVRATWSELHVKPA